MMIVVCVCACTKLIALGHSFHIAIDGHKQWRMWRVLCMPQYGLSMLRLHPGPGLRHEWVDRAMQWDRTFEITIRELYTTGWVVTIGIAPGCVHTHNRTHQTIHHSSYWYRRAYVPWVYMLLCMRECMWMCTYVYVGMYVCVRTSSSRSHTQIVLTTLKSITIQFHDITDTQLFLHFYWKRQRHGCVRVEFLWGRDDGVHTPCATIRKKEKKNDKIKWMNNNDDN